MAYSSLAKTYIPAAANNHYGARTHRVDKFTPHHMACMWSAETCAKSFQNPTRGASANYCIGSDGTIVCSLDENYAAGTSSNRANDERAITVEVANCATGGNWPISAAAWDALVRLGADVCRRHGFRLNYTGDASGSLTEHQMFSATACPGTYLHGHMNELARAVNALLDGGKAPSAPSYAGLDLGDTRIWGPKYTRELQKQRGTVVDGVVSGQTNADKPYFWAIEPGTVTYTGEGSKLINSIQKMLIAAGFSCGPKGADGHYGPSTIAAHQNWLMAHGISVGPSRADGYNGHDTNRAIAQAIVAGLYK